MKFELKICSTVVPAARRGEPIRSAVPTILPTLYTVALSASRDEHGLCGQCTRGRGEDHLEDGEGRVVEVPRGRPRALQPSKGSLTVFTRAGNWGEILNPTY